MRRLILALVAIFGLASGATAQNVGDRALILRSGAAGGALVSAINADGWSATTSSISTLMFQPDSTPQTITVKRAGYTNTGAATTYTDAVPITKQVRYPYPSAASLNPTRVALANYVYAGDTVVGAANNSTLAAPPPIVAWASGEDHQTIYTSGNTLTVQFVAAAGTARNQAPLAYADCTATDGTHTMTVTATFGDITSATDQTHIQGYSCTFSNMSATLTAGQITVNADAYPWIGTSAAVVHSSTGPTTYFAPLTFTFSSGSRYYAYASASGNDSTCVASTVAATASASPCLTPAGAVNKCKPAAADAGNCSIRLMGSGTFTWATPAQASAATSQMIVESDPAAGCKTATLNVGAAGAYNLSEKYTRLSCLLIVTTGANSLAASTGGYVSIVNSSIDGTGLSTSALINNAAISYFNGVTIINVQNANLPGKGSPNAYLYRGVLMGSFTTAPIFSPTVIIGCYLQNLQINPGGNQTPWGGIFVGFNLLLNQTANQFQLAFGYQTTAGTISGLAIVENVSEWASSSATQPLWGMFDGYGTGTAQAVVNADNVVIQNNTAASAFSAGRTNFFYDANPTSNYRSHTRIFVQANLFGTEHNKGDVYVSNQGADPTDAPLHVGNWSFYYGVGDAANYVSWPNEGLGCACGNWTYDLSPYYAGLGSNVQTFTGSTPTLHDPLFTANAATTYNGTTYTAGAGNGTYTLQSGSPVKGMVKTTIWPLMLNGTARATTNTNAGAY